MLLAPPQLLEALFKISTFIDIMSYLSVRARICPNCEEGMHGMQIKLAVDE